MKKLVSILLALALALAGLTGCAGGAQNSASTAASGAETVYKVGILQFVQHPSLDEITATVDARLQQLAAQNGVRIEVEIQNAQGDMTNITAIANQFAADKKDLVVAVATPAAQGAAAVLEKTEIPLVFSAVTDPVAAGLVSSMDAPGGNITGTSDAIPVENIFALAHTLTPDAEKFGLLYCTNEVNSLTVIKEAEAYCDANGLSYEESAVTAGAEVPMASQILLSKVDAVFIPIDNTVATAMSAVAAEAVKAGKPVYVAADSMVADGGLASVGVNYVNLGNQTADMAYRVLTGADPAVMPVEVLTECNIVINQTTADAIGVDFSAIENATVVA